MHPILIRKWEEFLIFYSSLFLEQSNIFFPRDDACGKMAEALPQQGVQICSLWLVI